MDFSKVKSLTIPEGNVVKIMSGNVVLWTKSGGSEPTPSGDLPPNNQVWYEAPAKLTSGFGSPVSHTYDASTKRGVLTYSEDITYSDVVATYAFKGASITKIWWPDCCASWLYDCMHTCPNLKEIYAGSGLKYVSNGTCNGGTSPEKIVLYNNENFYANETGLVKKSDNTLYLGTVNLDIRNTPCTTLGPRCMADMHLTDKTLYFPSTMTSSTGDWNIGGSTPEPYTIYLPCSTAPNWTLNYIRGIITWHIPATNSGYENWKTHSSDWTFVEDL